MIITQAASRCRAIAVAIAVAAAICPAGAAEAAKLTPDSAQALAERLGPRSAGTYYDAASDAMVVTVIDQASARKVRAAGGVARMVKHGERQLQRIIAEVDATSIPGIGFGVETAENKVVVSVDETVDAVERQRLDAVLADEGDAARIEQVPGKLETAIAGGEEIISRPVEGWTYFCSLGFNVDIRGTDFFLTAGHCVDEDVNIWRTPLGETRGVRFPEDDYGLVFHAFPTVRPGTVYRHDGTYQDILTAGNAYVGQRIQRSGRTTGLRSGTVTSRNYTANYEETLRSGLVLTQTVRGLVRTDACAEDGDSGGPVFAGTVALGLVSGRQGACSTTSHHMLFQPVTEALNRYGAKVY